MKKITLIIVLSCIGLSLNAEHAHRVKRQGFQLGQQLPETCTTPTGEAGRCISVIQCPQIHKILTARPIPAHLLNFLRQSVCGRDGVGRPKFCCGLQSTSSISFGPIATTAPPPAAAPTQARTDEPPATTPLPTSPPTQPQTPPVTRPPTTQPPTPPPTQPPTPPPTQPPTPLPTQPPTPPPTKTPTAPPTQPPTPPPTQPPTPPPTQPPTQSPTTSPNPETTEPNQPFVLSTTPNVIEETTIIIIDRDSSATVEETGGSASPTGQTGQVDYPSVLPRLAECGNSEVQLPRIVGGRDSKQGDWPWIAVLGYADGRGVLDFSCGGTLITHNHVLTAAHCVDGLPSLRVVRLGEHILSRTDEAAHEDYNIAQRIVHPDYNENFRNDIAILVLDGEVTFKKHILPACLPMEGIYDGSVNNFARPFVAGWGALGYNEDSADILQDVQVSFFNQDVCARSYARFRTVTIDERTLCAGWLTGGRDACQGDSGGPLITPYNPLSKYFLIGVVSLGFKCAEADYPGIYSRVSYYMPWILDNLSQPQ